jgi:hypothetical protein
MLTVPGIDAQSVLDELSSAPSVSDAIHVHVSPDAH